MDQRGTVFAEYVALLTLVAVGLVSVTMALGPPFLEWYRMQRAVLLLPVPS